MFKLLKYELNKRKTILIISVVLLVLTEYFALRLLSKGQEYAHIAAIINIIMFIGVIIVVFLDVVVQYYNDFKKSQGTLLFLTPNSGYKIVGSKMLFGAAELLLGIALVVFLAWITNSSAVAKGYVGVGPQLQAFIDLLNTGVGESNSWWVITGFLFLVFLQYTAGQSIAVTSITLGRTIFSKNNYNWFWAILFFIVVSIGVQTINGTLLVLVGMGDGLLNSTISFSSQSDVTVDITKYLILGGIEYILWIAASFVVSGLLLNKKVDI